MDRQPDLTVVMKVLLCSVLSAGLAAGGLLLFQRLHSLTLTVREESSGEDKDKDKAVASQKDSDPGTTASKTAAGRGEKLFYLYFSISSTSSPCGIGSIVCIDEEKPLDVVQVCPSVSLFLGEPLDCPEQCYQLP